MRKLLLVYTAIALLSLLSLSQAINLVSANPWAFSKEINPPPSAVPPVISISSPQNTSYSGGFNISFSIKPAQYGGYFSDILDVTYTIDNESTTIPHNADVLAIGQYYTSFIGPNLTARNHILTVKASGIVYEPMQVFFVMDGSAQVYFVTSGDNTTSINPSPSSSPSTNPTPTPSVPEFSWLIILSVFIFILSIAVIVVLRKKSLTQRNTDETISF